jgi:hypothetical protein
MPAPYPKQVVNSDNPMSGLVVPFGREAIVFRFDLHVFNTETGVNNISNNEK